MTEKLSSLTVKSPLPDEMGQRLKFSPYTKLKNLFPSLCPLWRLLEGYRWSATGILVLMFVAGLTEFVGLSMLIPMIGIAMGDLPANDTLMGKVVAWLGSVGPGLLPAAAVMVAGMLVKNILLLITVRNRVRLTLELRNRWAHRIFVGALLAPLVTLPRQRTGELVEAVTSETQMAANAVMVLLEVLRRFFLAVIFTVGLLITTPLLTLVVAISIALILMGLRAMRLFRSIDQGKEMLAYNREIANITAESTAHVRQIKLLNAYAEREAALIRALKGFARVRIRFETLSEIPPAAIEMTVVVIVVAGLTAGYHLAPDTLRSALPGLGLFLVVANRLVSIVGSLSNQIMKLNIGLANINYVADRLADESQAESLDIGQPLTAVKSQLELDQVAFSWPNGKPVLVDAHMVFPYGEVTAIIGASGRGKSTIAALLCGLLLPNKGSVRLDGRPLSEFNLRSLRRNVGYVTQEVELFHGSVLDNVRMGCPGATEEDAIRACQLADADSFIASMQEGYRTLIGEKGVCLSGGQRQRLALARALISPRSIYIFDEATSALDEKTQSGVQETIKALKRHAVVIVITHQPSGIRFADRVYRLGANGSVKLLSSAEISMELGDGSVGMLRSK
jgi:ABC-type bacteriocin/lantibiotic exporter with double-glycine peptidase domain